ncbi:glycosyltransferase family 9 protein [Phototrophicus methaneseepsis]|uniref:Glycosyltransferase family 9 protein n=1 Tax=Phototrophicus methaneseepsis TaxID=2710758 RepID=A0A7S8ICR3_9CHLR|nr:glycosyltransferase family 9 protein [Phototrophicus methaneseepsis]QPC80802.1 glycosyltransferase family 9 protein [Phototrophicus methaneseepsis]
MDRDALVHRNKQLTAAFHQAPMQHRLRRHLIEAAANFPFAPLNTRTNRILFIKPDHIGDVLLATPVFRAMKKRQPSTEIHVLAGPWASSVLANYRDVDLVLTLPFPGFDRSQEKDSLLAPYTQVIRVSRQLRHIGYSAAIILRPDHWWGALLAHAAGIRQRIGYNLPDVMPFLTQAIPYEGGHAIRQNLRLVERWTGHITDEQVDYTFEPFADESEAIAGYLQNYGITDAQSILCIHPGAGTWAKLWEAEKWAQVADTLCDQFDISIIFTGTMQELPMIQSIQNLMRHKSYSSAGDVTLGQLAALYQRAEAVLGADSGPLHLAAAVHTPTVTLFGPADPDEFRPWGDKSHHIVLASPIGCRPCRVLDWGEDPPHFHPCMRDITVGSVLEAARRALQAD